MDALIVEDDDLMADLLETVVAGLHPAMTVSKAAGFQEAIALWQQKKPGLLVVDWNLPDGSGLEIVRQVRATDRDVAIVMITGRADRESILKAAHYRINGYISKPFKVEMLHERLLAMVGKALPEGTSDVTSLDEMLSGGLDSVIQLPAKTDAASVIDLMARAEGLAAAQLAERWQNDASLCSRLLDVANRSSFRRTGTPLVNLRDAISSMGVPMALNQALALSLDVSAAFSSGLLTDLAVDFQQRAEAVGLEAQRMALALGKKSAQFQTAGLLSRMGELAVLKVVDQYLKQGGTLGDKQTEQAIRDWAQPYGNRLKVQWRLPLELRQLIGAVHYVSRENVTQDRLIMRAAALMVNDTTPEAERSRLLRQLGLEDWQAAGQEKGQGNDGS
ncbi:response regulator [Marinobacter sp. F4206]|uniref:response regulator n=1 Tax=Marinobacter sp. F4206 TaxID=2861777 RepID=UPI001C5DA227|nr:response regulator [Marinobacter sp. F4206]MBW4934761.1 response regulator [Marinobacter sp. F4206]